MVLIGLGDTDYPEVCMVFVFVFFYMFLRADMGIIPQIRPQLLATSLPNSLFTDHPVSLHYMSKLLIATLK
jgi:hypothetical protein